MAKFNVGDQVMVYITNLRDLPQLMKVTRVGRKYVYVAVNDNSVEHGFDIKTGQEAGHKYGYPNTVYTMDEWREEERDRSVKSKLLHKHSISPSRGNWRQSTDVLEKVLAVLDAELTE